MKLTEQEQEIMSKIDQGISRVIAYLRDHDFKNSKTRQEFAQLIMRLCNSKDPRSRLAIKRIGDFFSSLGTELLSMYDENGKRISGKVIESKIEKYEFESLFK